MKKIKDMLGSNFEKLRENNRERVLYIDAGQKENKKINREIINILLFKIFESELEHWVFYRMIRQSTRQERTRFRDYNYRILDVVNEEYKRSMYAEDKRNVELCTYLLIPKKEAQLPYRAMVRAFKFKRKWHKKWIYPHLVDVEKMFWFDDSERFSKNKSDFFKRMESLSSSRNNAAHEYAYIEEKDTNEMIDNFVYLINTLHTNLKEEKK